MQSAPLPPAELRWRRHPHSEKSLPRLPHKTLCVLFPLNGYARAADGQFERGEIMQFAVGVSPPARTAAARNLNYSINH